MMKELLITTIICIIISLVSCNSTKVAYSKRINYTDDQNRKQGTWIILDSITKNRTEIITYKNDKKHGHRISYVTLDFEHCFYSKYRNDKKVGVWKSFRNGKRESIHIYFNDKKIFGRGMVNPKFR